MLEIAGKFRKNSPRKSWSLDRTVRGIDEDSNTSGSEELEGRMTSELSQEFSKMKTHIYVRRILAGLTTSNAIRNRSGKIPEI